MNDMEMAMKNEGLITAVRTAQSWLVAFGKLEESDALHAVSKALLPKEVQAVEELEALPNHAVIRDADHWVFEKVGGAWLITGGSEPTPIIPACVLFLPHENEEY